MRSFMLMALAALTLSAHVPAMADTTSSAKVGVKQGGAELFIQSGGAFKIRDNSVLAVPIALPDLGGTVAAAALAPFPGTVSSIVCSNGAQHDAIAVVTAKINGVAITNGAVTVTSTATVGTDFTATPTAANTVAVKDVLSIVSDGTGSSVTPVGCLLYITP